MEDEKWMRRALHLAERGIGQVNPNPLVGAVIVRETSIGFTPSDLQNLDQIAA